MCGNAVVTAVTSAIRETRSKIAYFWSSARTTHGVAPSAMQESMPRLQVVSGGAATLQLC